ncbi:hypothetical protein [Gymnodinialimonas ulvae]|uniref:hypothetical protein n=1 Tax=Gymnodinialimonas ulvae TaxID=3126504 RepID=UPI0030B3D0ED
MTHISHAPLRVALLGEFSAGKSTLANLLLGRTQSPVRVTATQMPPLWYTFGDAAPLRILDDDTEEALPEDAAHSVPVEGTKAVKVASDAAILARFDLFDMPGSSDPNMAPDTWDRLMPQVDIAIWCTPATQAWRQSEAALWDAMPAALQHRSMLLLTRIDKVSTTDRKRVLQRVRSETADQFRHVLPVALLSAQAPLEQCEASGLSEVMTALEDLCTHAEPFKAPPRQPDRPTRDESAPCVRPLITNPRRVSTLGTVPKHRRRTTDANALI